jgi:hypothetical protein
MGSQQKGRQHPRSLKHLDRHKRRVVAALLASGDLARRGRPMSRHTTPGSPSCSPIMAPANSPTYIRNSTCLIG